MPHLGTPEILLILVVLVLLFGAKRLPEVARSTARSMHIFKTETKALRTDLDDVADDLDETRSRQGSETDRTG